MKTKAEKEFDKWIREFVGIQDEYLFQKGTLVRTVAIKYAEFIASQPSDFHSCNNCVSQFADDCPDINPEKNKCDKYLPKAQTSDVSEKTNNTVFVIYQNGNDVTLYKNGVKMKSNSKILSDAAKWFSCKITPEIKKELDCLTEMYLNKLDGQIKPTIEGEHINK